MYPLPLGNARAVNDLRIEQYRVLILTDCQSVGPIEYAHVAFVYAPNHTRPIYAVASETNRMARFMGGGSHFLCTYDDKHNNHGSADDWAELKIFSDEALYLITEHLVGTKRNMRQSPKDRLLQRHLVECQNALKTLDPKTDAEAYALTQLKLGETYYQLSKGDFGNAEPILKSIEAYQAALPSISPDTRANTYIDVLTKIVTNHLNVTMSSPTQEDILKARDAYQAAITGLTKPAMTEYLQSKENYIVARLHDELGNLYKMLGQMPAAISEWRLAQQVYQAYGRDKMVEYSVEKIAKAQQSL